MLHLIRKGITEACPVCDVDAFIPCVKAHVAPLQLEIDLDNNLAEIGFLEYEILRAIRRLRELRPEHTLVTVVEAVLKYQSTGQSPR